MTSKVIKNSKGVQYIRVNAGIKIEGLDTVGRVSAITGLLSAHQAPSEKGSTLVPKLGANCFPLE